MTETNTKETKIVKATPKKTESQEDAQPRVTVKAAVIPQNRNQGAARPARPQTQASERPASRPPMGKPVVNKDLENRVKTKMVATNLVSTGDENLLSPEMNDINFRKKQLEKLSCDIQ